jgi:AraC-like DNA-binding protein
MNKRIAQVKEVHFHNPRLAKVGVEVIDLEKLRKRLGAALEVPERPDFYLLLLVHGGAGRHKVDFVDYTLKAGDVLLVRPGQVQQWRFKRKLDAELVLASPEALAPFIARAEADMLLLALDDWPTRLHPSNAIFLDALADVRRLGADIHSFGGSVLEAAVIWHELLALFLRLARERAANGGGPVDRGREILLMFVREVEKQIHKRATVRELARRIGYSESTLSRACRAAAGHSAKEVVDQRIALEAKRLLVHSRGTVVHISNQLGFSEPTNFVKFFRRTTGTSPLAFRAAHLKL